MTQSVLHEIVAGRAPQVAPLTVEQYHCMIDQSILRDGESVELIDGVLVRKDRAAAGGDPMSHGPRHAIAVEKVRDALAAVRQFGFHLRSQLPVTLGTIQEPEPDLAVVRGQIADYANRHPAAEDLALLVEVADSSLDYDRTTKQRIYAAAAVTAYAIVNLVANQLELFEAPDTRRQEYTRRTVLTAGQDVVLNVGAHHIDLAVEAILP